MSSPDADLERQLTERIAANVEAANKAMEAASAEPWVEGSTGQPRAHPGFAVAASCDQMTLKLAEELRRVRRAQPASSASDDKPYPFAEVDSVFLAPSSAASGSNDLPPVGIRQGSK